MLPLSQSETALMYWYNTIETIKKITTNKLKLTTNHVITQIQHHYSQLLYNAKQRGWSRDPYIKYKTIRKTYGRKSETVKTKLGENKQIRENVQKSKGKKEEH